jgi:hypothetical protein
MSSNIYTVRVYVHQYLSWDTRFFLKNDIFDTSKTWTPEDLLTDEFLDKMLIPKGNVNKYIFNKRRKKNIFCKHMVNMPKTCGKYV